MKKSVLFICVVIPVLLLSLLSFLAVAKGTDSDCEQMEACIDELSMLWAHLSGAKPWDDVFPDIDDKTRVQLEGQFGMEWYYPLNEETMDQYLASFSSGINFLCREKNGLEYFDGNLFMMGGWSSIINDYFFYHVPDSDAMTKDIDQAVYQVSYLDDTHATVTLTMALVGDRTSIYGDAASGVYPFLHEEGSSNLEYTEFRDMTIEFERKDTGSAWKITGGTVITKLFDVRFPAYEGNSPDTGDGTLVGVTVLCLAAGSAVLAGTRKRKF